METMTTKNILSDKEDLMDINHKEIGPEDNSEDEHEKKDISRECRIEILEKKYKIAEKNQENEKEKIKCKMKKEIKTLKEESESLLNELESKDDKVRQLTNSNAKKDCRLEKLAFENGQLEKRKVELQKEISREQIIIEMSRQHQETIEAFKKQQEEMKKEIVSLKEQLELVRAERDEKDKELVDHMKKMETIIDEMKREAKIREDNLERKMEEREKKRDEYWEQKEKKQDEQFQILLSKLVKVNNTQNDGVFINEAQNLQVGGGNRIVNFVRDKSPRKKTDTSPRGKTLPVKQIVLTPKFDYSQPLRRKKINNKLPKFRP